MEFHATFHTTFSHRRIWMLSSTTKAVLPSFRRAVKPPSRLLSTAGSMAGFGKSPISVFSDLMWVTIPGDVCVAPTHVYDCELKNVKNKGAEPGWCTYNAAQNRAIWKLCPERILVSHTILDEYDGCCVVHYWDQRFGNYILIYGFVDTNNVVVMPSCICRIADH
jgi:hypothetical protein